MTAPATAAWWQLKQGSARATVEEGRHTMTSLARGSGPVMFMKVTSNDGAEHHRLRIHGVARYRYEDVDSVAVLAETRPGVGDWSQIDVIGIAVLPRPGRG